MVYNDVEQCPFCGSLRYNMSGATKENSSLVEHRFCRNCDNEYVIVCKAQSEPTVQEM